MKDLDYGTISNLIKVLKKEMKDVDIYHFVPSGVKLPYVSIELKSVGRGNGLPFPHFKARLVFSLKVWSAYQGLKELQEMMKKITEFLDDRELQIDGGQVKLHLDQIEVTGQQDTRSQQVRCGEISLIGLLKMGTF